MMRRLMLLGALATVALTSASAAEMADQEVVRIAQAVRREIVTLPNYGLFDDIRFGIDGSTVFLRGQASRPTLKKSAERVVAAIEGVDEVKNEIEVLTFSRNDDRIRTLTYIAIYGNPVLSRYNPNRGSPLFRGPASLAGGLTNDPPRGFHPIHIIVNNGNVRLTGVVDTSGDKAIAGIRANQVDGAFRVDNELVVANAEEMGMMGGDEKGKKAKKAKKKKDKKNKKKSRY